jgi:hypothetical protein
VRRKTLLKISVCTTALAIIFLLVWSLFFQQIPQIPQKYEKNITRNFDNPEKQSALAAAESMNYSSITSLERFGGSDDPDDYLHPSTYIAYTSANFIDSEVINYYEARYDNQQGKEYPMQIELTYKANVTKYSQFRIYNSPAPEGVTWHNTTIVMSAPNSSVAFNSGNMQFFYKNQSGYQMIKWEYDFNYSDCYVVMMKLEYSEIYAPLAAFFVRIEQIVVLDSDFEPVLFGLESGMAVS